MSEKEITFFILIVAFFIFCFLLFCRAKVKPDESINRALSVQYESLYTQMKEIEKKLQEDKNPLFNSNLKSEIYDFLNQCKTFIESASRFYGFEEKVKKIQKRHDSLKALYGYFTNNEQQF